MKIYNELESLGFFEWLSETHNLKDTDMTPEHLDELSLNDIHRTVCNSMALRWFREKYDLHVQIRKENYVYQKVHCNYFHFDISKGEQNDITKQEDLHSNIMDECEQDIPGNYLDNEKLNILIFEKGFAFKTYEEVEIECIKKLIEIVKENKT